MPGLSDADILHGLVRIPSVTGSEAQAVAWMQEQARQDGLRVHDDAVGNFVCDAGTGGRLLLLVGHIDTVPGHIDVRWEDDALWGRGAVDAKGCLAAFYAAARHFRDDARLTIRVAGCVDEEGQSRGVRGLARGNPEAIVVGEPSGADGFTIGYKGILRGQLHVVRDTHHAGHPWEGACDALIRFWSHVRNGLDFAFGYNSIDGRVDRLSSERDGLQEQARAGFQLRLPPGSDPGQIMDRMNEWARDAHVDLKFTEALAPCETSDRSPLASLFRHAIRSQGMMPRTKRKTGTADFNHLGIMHPQIPMVAYGPGDSHLDHTPNERLERREFEAAVRVLVQVIENWANRSEALPSPPLRSPN